MTDPPATDPEPWLRRPGETTRQHEAFQTYLEMGAERSLQKANDKLATGGKPRQKTSISSLKQWSIKHEWVARVRAWDDAKLAERRARFAKETDAATDRWIRQAVGIQGGMAALLRELGRRVDQAGEEGGLDFDGMTDQDLVQLLSDYSKPWRAAIDLERLARGLETQRVQHQGQVAVAGPDPLLARVLQDPEARAAAVKLIEGLADAKKEPPAQAP